MGLFLELLRPLDPLLLVRFHQWIKSVELRFAPIVICARSHDYLRGTLGLLPGFLSDWTDSFNVLFFRQSSPHGPLPAGRLG